MKNIWESTDRPLLSNPFIFMSVNISYMLFIFSSFNENHHHNSIRVVIFLITINQIVKNYGKNKALDGITLSIPKGICYGIVGPNGAGKTTLLKIMSSIIRDFTGEIQLSQEERIGYIPQEICLEQTLSAYSNLCFFGKLFGLKGKKLRERAEQVLEEIGLSQRGKDKVKDFSGGMKRRLNIGCALMHDPKLVIMDEPTVGIDPQSRRFIFKMIERMKERSCTIIYASHYMEEVEQLCDYVAFMDQGKIIEEDNIHMLLQKYAKVSVFVQGDHPLPATIKNLGEVTPRNNGYMIVTENPIYVMNEILASYEKVPSSLERLELLRPRLEDVFFTLTGNALRDNTNQHEEVI